MIVSPTGMVALTNFQFGAMENWGLIVYREEFVLILPGYTSALAKAQIGSIIGHELAHNVTYLHVLNAFWF